MSRSTYVVGVGMVPFAKPRQSAAYTTMGSTAARTALNDAGIAYDLIEQAYVGYVYGDSASGQAALYEIGRTGIPVVNVNNNCATGSTALFLARQAVESGAVECALALGFEQMSPGVLSIGYTDRPSPLAHFDTIVDARRGPEPETPLAPRYFGNAGLEYMERFGAAPQTFAEIAVKARRHAANNPYAVFRDPVSVDEVMSSPHVYGALTRLQCCPPTCGAAAAVVCSEDFARRHGLDTTVRIAAQKMVTDFDTTFDPTDLRRLVGYDLTATAAAEVYEAAGVTPTDIDVVELHDCFTANELITYEALGLTPEGTAEKFILDGQNTYGGQIVTNPSGGLLSKGHPLGATGLAQCSELVWQLRGSAAARQVDGARLALQHNLGLGGACVVTVYERA